MLIHSTPLWLFVVHLVGNNNVRYIGKCSPSVRSLSMLIHSSPLWLFVVHLVGNSNVRYIGKFSPSVRSLSLFIHSDSVVAVCSSLGR